MVVEPRSYRLLDLFAGCGGLTQGFVETGRFRPVGAVESDLDAAATYACNFGAQIHVGDIGAWSSGSLPLAEVVVGGPPCQGFSPLGSRAPMDPRNDLWKQYVRVLQRVRPAFFVLENVPQFLSSPEFMTLLGERGRHGALHGWDIESHVLDAGRYGVAQSRRRAIVIGRPTGVRALGPPPETSRLALSDVLGGVDPTVDAHDLPDASVEVLGRQVPGAFKTADLHVTPSASPISLS